MIGQHSSTNMRVIGTLVVPFVLMFGVYVAAHGHYGPGGGFAGGVILAVGVVIIRMIAPTRLADRFFPPGLALWLMVGGIAVYLAVGIAGLVTGGDFLGYDTVPLPGDRSRRHYLAIAIVEFGVAATVFGAMVFITDLLGRVGRKR